MNRERARNINFHWPKNRPRKLIKTLENLKVKIKQKYKAEAVGIFGSFVK